MLMASFIFISKWPKNKTHMYKVFNKKSSYSIDNNANILRVRLIEYLHQRNLHIYGIITTIKTNLK